jgi:peptidyl-prolyl cis-trans isomerase B (cyclophilin B)
MKRVFLNRLNALVVPFSLTLALTLGLGVTTVSHADAKSLWNPMHWLSSDQATNTAATDARKKADLAQQAADQAMQDAQKAIEKAAEARRQVEALEKSPHIAKKPMVTDPYASPASQAQAQPEPNSEKSSKTTVYQAPAHAAETNPNIPAFTSAEPKREPWNPMNWFHKDPDKETGLDNGLPLQNPVSATPAAKQATQPQAEHTAESGTTGQTEASQAPSRGNWNLMKLFIKPSSPQNAQTATTTHQQENTPETVQKTEASAATEAQTETKPAEAQAEGSPGANQAAKTEEASTPSKGGWNLMSLLSKPGPAADASQTKPQPAQAANQSAQPDSAETDQSVKTKAALIETERGNIAIELYPDQAPLTVNNFVKLVNTGFYNRFNMKFHRVVPGFVVQTGDPTGTGAGGSKERVPLEAKNKLSHNLKGIVAMARGADPNSATSQFYITLAPQPSLDGKYAVFGKVISGIDVLSKIEKDDQLYGIRLVDLSTVVRDQQPEKKNFFSSMF